MARSYFGILDGYPCIKITASDGDDPKTTPDTQYGKFLFNSLHEHGYVQDIHGFTPGDYAYGAVGTDLYTYVGGSGPGDAPYRVRRYNTSNASTRRKEFQTLIPNLPGYAWPPIVETRLRRTDGWFAGPALIWSQYSSGELGRYSAYGPYNGASEIVSSEGGFSGHLMRGPGVFQTSESGIERVLSSVWDLPAMDDALQGDGGSPSGKLNLQINTTVARMTRRGFDCATATGRQFIFNSDRIPAKILASGETTCAASTTTNVAISSPFALTDDMYVDFNVQRSGEPMSVPALSFVGNFGDRDFDFDYRIDVANSRIQFRNNSNKVLTVRWMLLADDSTAYTSGGSRIMRTGNSGGIDWLQIKRPGSSDAAPALNDIILDSRLRSLRIVAEGFIPWAGFTETTDNAAYGAKRKTISFTNPGWTPFLKYTVVRADGSYMHPAHYAMRVNTPTVDDPGSWSGKPTSQSAMAIVASDNVRFYLSADNPWTLTAEQGGGGVYAQAQYAPEIKPTGLRYYIFALP